MKISVNDQELFTLTDIQIKVLADEIQSNLLDSDLKRRLQWILMHKYENCFANLKQEWEPKLKASGVDSIPLDNDKFAELVFSQPGYKDRAARDKDANL